MKQIKLFEATSTKELEKDVNKELGCWDTDNIELQFSSSYNGYDITYSCLVIIKDAE